MTARMERVEIYDVNESGVLTFDLIDVLRVVEPYQSLQWHVLDLEATGALEDGGSITELETRVAESPTGLQFGWGELIRLACHITQTIDATIVGTKPSVRPPTFPLQDLEGLEIVIEAIDTTLWAISTRDEELISRVRATFRNTKVLNSSL